MYMFVGRVMRGRTLLDADQVRKLMYAAADIEDRLEHVYAETDFDGASAMLFLSAHSAGQAEAAALRIVARFLENDELCGWEWAGRTREN
ncbi:hypothetical protein [Streptomyces boncukensis]|uniref:Uncharacterized protein n=1 Tax=Streptomyces boncukensis TaxID=2711219 RepID=A0A6G4WY67_9ACTN|nr:hypothetical protein [Streptomyces boncukensis]NGO70239.1 hypothetical protein [Streptomyces boncukensis]